MSTGRRDDDRSVDEAVDQAWRGASDEEPGPRLDAAILAAARAEAERARGVATGRPGTAPRPAPPRVRDWWTSWQPLATVATVAGLAFVLIQTIPRERDVAPPIAVERAQPEASQAPAAGEARDAGAAPPAFEARSATDEPASFTPEPPAPAAATTAPPARAPSSTPPPAPAEVPATAPVAETAESVAAPPTRNRPAAAAQTGVAAEADRALGESQRAMKSAEAPRAPEDWAARIEELLQAGDPVAAAEELRAFRAVYADADAYLPEGRRDWAVAVD